jgi:hypothetical protein
MDNDPVAEEELQIERQARAMHNAIAQKHGCPSWDEADEDVRSRWLRSAREMHEIGKNINYDD